MRIAVTEFVSLDGVSQGPGSADEDTTDGFDRGGWFVPYLDGAFMEIASGGLDRADGLLLGHRTYDAFARDWPQITDPDDPFTARMNGLPKYVVTSSDVDASWNPTTVLRGDLAETVGALRDAPGRELQVHGSARLAASLLDAGLVDTLRLVVAPTIVGRGRRLLDGVDESRGLRLVEQRLTPGGLLALEYELVGAAPRADYVSAVAHGA